MVTTVNQAMCGRWSWSGRSSSTLGAGGGTIQQLTTRLPRDLGESIGTLAFATGEPVDDHVLHALQDYLDGCGHTAAVSGFTDRARDRFRAALDRLKDL
jgi:hypothetical protein